MRTVKIILTVICISFTLIFLSCKKDGSAASGDSISALSGGSGEWVLKIDKLTVNQDIFNKDLTALLKLSGQPDNQIEAAKNDNGIKQDYTEKLINDVLLLRKADEEKFFESEENKSIIDAAIRNLKVQYYTQKLMNDASATIPEPTEEQAKAFFEQAKAQIAQAYGITAFNTETRLYINQLYKMAFAEQMVQRTLSDLKDKSIIQRNETILGKPSLIPGGTLQQQPQQILPRVTN